MITTCHHCRNTGVVGERYCSCEAAAELRDRIETSPEFAEFRRKRAEVDYMLNRLEYSCARCHAPMHALQACYPAFDGSVCHACHTRPPEPRYLTLGPLDNPEVN